MVFGRSKVTPEADNAPEADDAQRQQLLAASATPSDDRYDLVLVHSKTDETDELTRRRQLIATRARLVGISVVREESSDGQEVLLKLSAPDAVLAEAAERTSMEKRLKTGEGYKDFTRAAMGDFSPASDASFFTSSERIHLLLALLELGLAEGGCDLDMNQEVEAGVLSQVVPMHERGVASGALMSGWCRKPLAFLPDQPLDEVKDYLGERVALYFAFMQHLVRSLVAPSIAGCLVLAWDGYSGSSDNILAPLYSFFMLCWVVAFAKVAASLEPTQRRACSHTPASHPRELGSHRCSRGGQRRHASPSVGTWRITRRPSGRGHSSRGRASVASTRLKVIFCQASSPARPAASLLTRPAFAPLLRQGTSSR